MIAFTIKDLDAVVILGVADDDVVMRINSNDTRFMHLSWTKLGETP